MLIKYASSQRWVKDIHDDIFSDFGKNNTKKISKLLNLLDLYDISYEYTPLTEDILEWFIPLYTDRISKKNNPNLYNIRAATLGKDNPKYPHFCLTLFEKGTPVGGTIFTLRENRLSIAFRSYFDSWNEHAEIICSPALFAEYLITIHAKENGKPRLIHGKDRNPYGIFSNIGVAIFKLSVGCFPQIQGEQEIREMDLSTVKNNLLVLQAPEKRLRITHAYLITSKEDENKFQQVCKYPERLNVQVVYRD